MRYTEHNTELNLESLSIKGVDISRLEKKYISQPMTYQDIPIYEHLRSVVQQWSLLTETISFVETQSSCR